MRTLDCRKIAKQRRFLDSVLFGIASEGFEQDGRSKEQFTSNQYNFFLYRLRKFLEPLQFRRLALKNRRTKGHNRRTFINDNAFVGISFTTRKFI